MLGFGSLKIMFFKVFPETQRCFRQGKSHQKYIIKSGGVFYTEMGSIAPFSNP